MREVNHISEKKIDKKSKEEIIDLIINTIEQEKQSLVFTNSKSSSEKTAEKIYDVLPSSYENEELKKISEKALNALSSPTRQCRRLSKLLTKGIVFHHSGLVPKQRALIEKEFRKGTIKVICSTPTLAAGLNLPAYNVIVKDYKRYSQRGFNDIPVLEYHQMSGRAGRPGKEAKGLAIIYVKSEEELDRIVKKYINGEPEEIISKLAVEPTLKMYILSLIAIEIVNSKEEILNFFSNTLYAHQYKDIEAIEYHLSTILKQLKEYGFIENQEGYYIATPMGKRISQLYLNPDTANYFLENINSFFEDFSSEIISKNSIYSLIFFVVNTLEMRPLFRVLKKEEEKYVQRADEIGESLVVGFDPFEGDYTQFLCAIKTTDVFYDWMLEAHEDFLSEKYNITPGELNYKLDVLDWLLYSLEEISLLKKQFFFKNFLNKLRIRAKLGIKEELIPLISLVGIGRVRARKLYEGGFRKILDLKRADTLSISRIVGEKIARKIKEQITDGEEIKDKVLDKEFLQKPKEIAFREVEEKEIDSLISHYEEFEQEKEKNRNLFDYF